MTQVTTDNAGEVARVTAGFLKEFDPSEIKKKPSKVSGNRALALFYIDARLVMDRLDEVVGVNNWRDEYVVLSAHGEVECRLSVRIADEWITKADVGGQSEQPDEGDRMKAAFSDALKRAAVKFGIGRFLYRIKQQWLDYDPVKKQFAAPAAAPAKRPDAGPKAEPVNNPALRAEVEAALRLVRDRAGFEQVYRQYMADYKAGKFGPEDEKALLPVFEQVGRTFPKPKAAPTR